jgi:acyl-CoA thioester hydrolase
MKFSHSFRVEPTDIDEQGHVNNVSFLRWIQDVAVAHWRHSATAEQQGRFSWVVVRHEIDYKKQAFLNDEITATTWVGEWSKVTCERFTEIRRNEELIVQSRTVWCMLDRKTAKPARIASNLVERFV